MAKVDIIVPIYNQAKYLKECIDSILNQGLQDYFITVVNDGSTDNVVEVLDKNYAMIRNMRLIQHKENKGLSAALNTGVQSVAGKYLTWMSADSYYGTNCLKKLEKFLDEHEQVGLVCSDFKIFGARKDSYCPKKEIITFDDLLKDNYVRASFMYHRILHNIVGYYNEELKCAEDWDMWKKISRAFKIQHICEAFVYQREYGKE